MAIPQNPETLLTRAQLGAALREAGFPVADKTLATKATRGGGPPFRRFGARVLYRWSEALEWAESRLSAPVDSTSELEGFSVTRNFMPISPKIWRSKRVRPLSDREKLLLHYLLTCPHQNSAGASTLSPWHGAPSACSWHFKLDLNGSAANSRLCRPKLTQTTGVGY